MTRQEAADLVKTVWRPHLGALHTQITAADYDGVFKLVANLSLDVALMACAKERDEK